MSDDDVLLLKIFAGTAWLVGFAALGWFLGCRRYVENEAFLLSLILGPVGILIALFLDGRPKCPWCMARIERGGMLYQHCRQPLAWKDNEPLQQPAEAKP